MSGKKSKSNSIAAFFILFICLVVMMCFVYVLVKLSLQNGNSSSQLTQTLSYKIGTIIFDQDMDEAQIVATNRILRFTAHFCLFAFLGYGLGVVGFLLFSRPFGRFLSLLFDIFVCGVLSYMTEYYKQFVEGRHFQIGDAAVNVFGSAVGICIFLISMVVFWGINARRR